MLKFAVIFQAKWLEWILGSVMTHESYESTKYYLSDVTATVAEINVCLRLSMPPPQPPPCFVTISHSIQAYCSIDISRKMGFLLTEFYIFGT